MRISVTLRVRKGGKMRQQRRSIQRATRTQEVKTLSKSTRKKILKFDPVSDS